MITISSSGWTYRIVGIDNGTNTVGFTVIDHNLRTGISTVVFAETITADRSAYIRFPGVAAHRSKLHARLQVIRPWIADLLEEHDPDIVGCESPFAHLGISTYATLLKSMDAIEDEVYDYRSTLDFVKIPPGKAKKAVCPPGQYKNDKEEIRQFILKDDRIVAGSGIVLDLLDEHCIDGIAVARCLALDAARAFA
jgi:Holliday junction resolvasome RuvABC endonuclease subunit